MPTPLWAPWRMPYIERAFGEKKKDEGCFFCEHAKDEATFRENLVLVVQEHAIALLNRFPFAPAHVLVAPRRHVPDIKDLSDEEYLALMTLLRDTRVRLERAVRCPAVNIGFNLGAPAGAGVADHCHGHLVPRWPNDTNFMAVLADTRVMPEALDETWQKLHVAFADVAGLLSDTMNVVVDRLAAAKRRHTIFLAVTGVITLSVLIAAHTILLPFVLAIVIAYVLTPLVAWVERKKVPRAAAIILVYIVVLGGLGGFLRLTAPRIAGELAGLRRELPTISKTIKREWVPSVQEKLRAMGLGGPPPNATPPDPRDRDGDGKEDPPAVVAREREDGSFALELNGPIAINQTHNGSYIIEPVHENRGEPFDLDRVVADATGKSLSYVQHNALELVRIGRDIIAGVSRFFFVFGLTLMLAAYTMLTRERIMAFFTSLVRPSSRPSWHELLKRIDRGLSGVVRGQLVICCVNGALSAVGFAVVGLKYWPVLAIVAMVFSLIPIFGSIASAVPAVILGLTQSVGTAVFVLIWILGIHQLEANILNPKIMGDSAKIHPLLVVFSLLVGEHFFGVVGALLAVPVMSIAQNVFIHVRKQVQALDPEMSTEPVGSIPPSAPEVATAGTPR